MSNNTYYYKVRTHRANGILPAESGDSNIEFRVDQPCLGNLSPSTMSLYQVNGVAYNSSTKIKAGDKLTYKIVIINAGPSSVVISHKSSTPAICENSTSNLLGLTNLVLVSGTASNGGISGNSANCLAKGNIGPELLITGTKDIANNWIMTFDTTFKPSDPNDPQEIVTNSAIIYYTDGNGLHQQTVGPVSVFATTNKARVPTFREVAP